MAPSFKPLYSEKMLSALERNSSAETSPIESGDRAGRLDECMDLSTLKELIAAGDHRLDPMLAAITDTARQLANASGAALAMWKEGAMVCRARSGDTAPLLGARLSAESGISGECLRTGRTQHCADTEDDPLVDAEVCRTLGLRSIVALPIQGWRGINGILEVFSTEPAAFNDQHIAVLQEIAALAERARASQPHDASSVPSKPRAETPQTLGLLPASDRVKDVVLASLGSRTRPFVLAGGGLVATSLLALVIWLGWRGADQTEGKAQVGQPVSGDAAVVNNAAANAATPHFPGTHLRDNDPVWNLNPGGESLFRSGGKASAGTLVKFASKVDGIAGKRSQADRSPLLADLAGKFAADLVIPKGAASSRIGSYPDLHSDDTASAEPPSIPASVSSQLVLDGVLAAKASLPGFSPPVSQGVSGGQLVHRVSPVYPAQARLLRLEGRVTLAAVVMEDGRVRDVKVVEGSPVLAPSAVDAVRHWRYKPFELDGKPVKNEIAIIIDFKLPSDDSSR